jgi:hypothetical protein
MKGIMSRKAINNSLQVAGLMVAAIGGYTWWNGRHVRLGQALLGLGALTAMIRIDKGHTSDLNLKWTTEAKALKVRKPPESKLISEENLKDILQQIAN